MHIRETSGVDLNDILFVEGAAFDGGQEVEFTRALLADPSAKPLLSLMAFIRIDVLKVDNGHVVVRRIAWCAHTEND
jgi:hypothetical protein